MFTLFTSFAYPQKINVNWTKTFASPFNNSNDLVSAIYVDASGDLIIVGTVVNNSNDRGIQLLKYTGIDGNLIIDSRYITPYCCTNAYDVAVGPDLNIYIAGYDNRFTSLFKYNVITQSFSQTQVAISDDEIRQSLLSIDNTGNIYITCSYLYFNQFGGDNKLVTKKYSPNLTALANHSYGSASSYNYNRPYDMKIIQGNIYIAGRLHSTSHTDFGLLKYDSLLNLKWVRTYNGSASEGDTSKSLTFDSENNIILVGTSTETGSGSDITTIKYDDSGSEIWKRHFNGSGNGNDQAVEVIIDDDDVFVLGRVWNGSDYDGVLIKYDSAGTLQWNKTIAGLPGTDEIISTMLSSEGVILVGGGLKLDTSSGYDFFMKAYTINGDFAFSEYYNGAGNGDDYIVDMKTNNYGEIFVSGNSMGPNSNFDIVTIMYTDMVNVNQISGNIPSSFSLHQNYPNPFNPTTSIKFKVKSLKDVKLSVYNNIGKEVAVLVNEKLSAGEYEYQFDGSNLSSGVYFYRLLAGEFVETRKMVLMK